MRKLFFAIFFLCLLIRVEILAQATYLREQLTLTNMLNGTSVPDLRQAVYSVENAYFNGGLDKNTFYNQIDMYAEFCRKIIRSGDIRYEGQGDEPAAKAQCAVFVLMTDSVPVQIADSLVWHLPFEYNFDDYAGQKDWSNMFVSTLMQTGKGNCHSMPLLYKMIMDSLGEKCWLSLAPNHMYIKAWNKRAGWYNIELTCGDFPTDAWLTASGYIHLDAIRNGIYMDTLSVKQSVALCLTDLAQGYMHKYGIGDGKFIVECCDSTLKYYPNYINALLLKAQIVTHQYKQEKDSSVAQRLETEMNELYTRIHQLGYRKMPKEMYFNWLYSLNEYSNEYRIKKITTYFRKSKQD